MIKKNLNFRTFSSNFPQENLMSRVYVWSRGCAYTIFFFFSRAENLNDVKNEFTDLLEIKNFYPKTLLNCAALFQRLSLGGVLLTSGNLSSASHFQRKNPFLCKLFDIGPFSFCDREGIRILAIFEFRLGHFLYKPAEGFQIFANMLRKQ